MQLKLTWSVAPTAKSYLSLVQQQQLLLISLICCCCCLNIQFSEARDWHQQRLNLFDPIFAYDDVDAHYVSPSRSSSTTSQTAPQSPTSTSLLPLSQSSAGTTSGSFTSQSDDSNRLKTLLSQIPDAPVKQTHVEQSTTLANYGANRTTTPALSIDISSTQARESEIYDLPQPQVDLRTRSAKEEPAHHWSGLENYYQKLRQSQNYHQLPTHQIAYQVPTSSDLYKIIQQQQEVEDTSFGGYNKLANYLPGNVVLSNRHPVAKLNPAFLLPLVNSFNNNQQQQQQQPQQLQLINQRPINLSDNTEYGFTVYHNTAPGISKTGGIGAGSIVLRQPTHQGTDSASLAGAPPLQLNSHQRHPEPQIQVPVPTNIGDDDRLKYLEWRKLPEMLLIQQQQQRVRHQQETFGSWYDQQRSRELLQEEAFCGPRNYISLNSATQSTGSGSSGGGDSSTSGIKGLDKKYVQAQLARLQLAQLDGSQVKLDAPVNIHPLSPNEYPSHIGLYNGSVNDENFLCAATWIHESFALTVASCVKSMEARKILFRLGEWNLNRNLTSESKNSRPLVTGQVDQVHIFPKFRNDSVEHNLALIHFSRPVEFLEWPYVCPACQVQTRSSIRTSSCWAPSRNVSLIEYFDAEGEGETKERKNVGMVDLPVKLVANDDAECQRQTKVEFFNFQHPNYICSGDYRKSVWRARLNTSDTFGSGIYCNEDGNLSLVSIVHPINANSSSAYGYMDLSYYRPWMRNIISGRNYRR